MERNETVITQDSIPNWVNLFIQPLTLALEIYEPLI